MNRLIILGNGFDIAHGIKTTFKDFIADYFLNVINTVNRGSNYKDKLIEITHKYIHIYQKGDRNVTLTLENVFEEFNIIRNNSNLNVQISPILNRIYSKIEQLNWVDLEVEYFELLLELQQRPNKIEDLNAQFEELKIKLIDYLKKQEDEFNNIFELDYMVDCFCEDVKQNEIISVSLRDEKTTPQNLCFLNFNYTNTYSGYYKKCNDVIKSDINYIHGNLSGTKGNPIFGFGDELDERYIEFEKGKNTELFKHIKSFEYLKTKNYYSLIRFVKSESFQVHIYGHSCGISDRTLLNQIFEDENCKSIKIFYHERKDGSNDFTEKTYEIARHFKDKVSFRMKLVPFELSKAMPQPKME